MRSSGIRPRDRRALRDKIAAQILLQHYLDAGSPEARTSANPLERPSRHGRGLMTTLIVGCGYLGRRVGWRLRQRGERVFGTVRSGSSAKGLEPWGIEPVIADVLDPGAIGRLPEADRVVYCVGFDRAAGIPMRAVYVDGLKAVLDRLGSVVTRIVYASSTGVFGKDDGGWVDEGSPTEPRHESGRVCLDAEDVVRASGVHSVVIRYAGLYGPGRIVRRDAVAKGEFLVGDPDRFLNLIHIDDAAGAAVAALDVESAGPLYVACDDRPVPRRLYYAAVAAAIGAPEPRFRPPEPGSPESRREEANKRVRNDRIKADLNLSWMFPTIESGVPDALARSGNGPAG